MVSDAIRSVAVPQECSEPCETGLLRGRDEAESTRCCPIALQETGEIPTTPEGAAQECEDAGKAVLPSMHESQKAQEDIDAQSRPYLPAHSLRAVTEETSQLQSLLDLLEERFDGPAATVKIGDTGRAPLQIVGEENHLLFASVDFH